MNDRPTAVELVVGARQYLEGELLPTLTDQRLKFQTLIAANVLSIVERELQSEEEQLLWEWEWLAELFGLTGAVPPRLTALRQEVRKANVDLCERIRRGEFDDEGRFTALAGQLRRTVERKLAVANPRYLASFQAPPQQP